MTRNPPHRTDDREESCRRQLHRERGRPGSAGWSTTGGISANGREANDATLRSIGMNRRGGERETGCGAILRPLQTGNGPVG